MSAEASELHALLSGAASGDRQSFARLYASTSAKLFGVVLRICRDRAVAEDVLQETYIRIWRSAGRYDPSTARPITWMVAIARNAAIDAVRREGPRAVRTVRAEEAENLPDPIVAAVHPADRQALSDCLGRLAEQQRDCVVLAYRDGWSREELAERYSRPVGTIKTWLHRALARLKDCLDNDE